MYDLAKRSLACTVATGGLLLTGAAFSPAMAAGGLGTTQGPARAQEAGSAVNASSALRSATASGSGEAAAKARPQGEAAQPPDLLFPQFLTDGSGSGAAAHTVRPGGDAFRIPIALGRRLCDTVRGQAATGDTASGACAADPQSLIDPANPDCADAVTEDPGVADEWQSACAAAEGSAPTVPDSAADSGGANATALSSGLGRMPIDVPESVPLEARAAALPMGGCADEVSAADDEVGVGDDEDAQAGDECAPHPHGSWHDTWTCTPPPPPTCTPPNHPPTTHPPTHFSFSATPPPSTTPPSTPPPTPQFSFTPPQHHQHRGHLPQTGADIEIALGVAAAALLAGVGLSSASRRRQRGH